jgi:hypothetical protein
MVWGPEHGTVEESALKQLASAKAILAVQILERHCHRKAAAQRFRERFGFDYSISQNERLYHQLGRNFLPSFEQLTRRR